MNHNGTDEPVDIIIGAVYETMFTAIDDLQALGHDGTHDNCRGCTFVARITPGLRFGGS